MSTPNAINGKKEEAGGAVEDAVGAAADADMEEKQLLCRAVASTPTPLAAGPGSKMAAHSGVLADACCEGGRVVILNVGGQKHEVLRKNFDRYPGSRLWKLMRAESIDEILLQCDRYRVAPSNDEIPEFFFDRNYTSFVNILVGPLRPWRMP